MIKSRFCPSPTGHIHVGNVRTALFNVLAAAKGIFLVRIEDTDKTRSYAEHTESLLADLTWLGLSWQEGPGVEGDDGPYWQSERQAIYDKYYDILIKKGLAYPCYCSEETLQLNRKIQAANHQPPRYPGTCRDLSDEEKASYEARGIKATLRYCIDDAAIIEFDDMVKGRQQFKGSDIGDFIIRRADGSASFMFANAIDDSLMGVNVALRGEDHLTNTPRQISLLRALSLREPTYGHLSLILGDDGTPLSKRNGSVSVHDLRDAGYFPIAILNYLARLGHYYETDLLLTLSELSEQFDTKHLSKSPARFDEKQLQHWQKLAMLAATDEVLLPYLPESFPKEKEASILKLIRDNCLFPKEVNEWLQRFTDDRFVLNEDCWTALKSLTEKNFFEVALDALESGSDDFKTMSDLVKTQLGVKGKNLFRPFRLALTGLLHGPELPLIVELMGSEQIKKRFHFIIKHW